MCAHLLPSVAQWPTTPPHVGLAECGDDAVAASYAVGVGYAPQEPASTVGQVAVMPPVGRSSGSWGLAPE